jgi:hypothetical protein
MAAKEGIKMQVGVDTNGHAAQRKDDFLTP